ncbi:hypothetical protein K435DRAFT_802846 [Dendrothele bispora CBS 962.96]|uniref:Uncharacterized protein n=1 Tax=Dendrothele bispora (strain CBS 962.96) TaxID=1314807 RepID=A0A4S8LJI9_DENBC|nr:hypothetical protein K435DRAFT_802846 [Dendrothele bispora CBS 962.96]
MDLGQFWLLTNYYGTVPDPSRAKIVELLLDTAKTLPQSYSLSWVNQVWTMIDNLKVVLQTEWKSKVDADLLNCAVVEGGTKIVGKLRCTKEPQCFQLAINLLLDIIDCHAVGAAYQSWIMEKAADPTTFEDLKLPPTVNVGIIDLDFKGSILRRFNNISHAIKTAKNEHELRLPFDALLLEIFEDLYHSEATIRTKYAPTSDNPSPNTRTDGFVILPLEGVALTPALEMVCWAMFKKGPCLGQLAVQYKKGKKEFIALERQLTCDLVTASTNLVLGIIIPAFGLVVDPSKTIAYICEAKKAPMGTHKRALDQQADGDQFINFDDLTKLSNYLRFVSFLFSLKIWYPEQVKQFIPPGNKTWIQRQALEAHGQYGPWRNIKERAGNNTEQ